MAAAALLLSVPASGQNPAPRRRLDYQLCPGDTEVNRSHCLRLRDDARQDARRRVRDHSHVRPHLGTIVTAYLTALNEPRYCAARRCAPSDFANPATQATLLGISGQVVGDDGTADFAEMRLVGNVTNAVFAGPGVRDTRQAEIYLSVRTHGPASPVPAVCGAAEHVQRLLPAERVCRRAGAPRPDCQTDAGLQRPSPPIQSTTRRHGAR